MAATMGHMSMLPAIKCSNCGADVDLAMMGDHECTSKGQSAPLPSSSTDNLPTPPPDAPHITSKLFADAPISQQKSHLGGLDNVASTVVTTPSGVQRMNLGPVGTAVSPVNSLHDHAAETSDPGPAQSPQSSRPYLTDEPSSAESATPETNNPYFWQSPIHNDAQPSTLSPASAPDLHFDSPPPHSPLLPSPHSAPAPPSDRPESTAIFHQFANEHTFAPAPPPPERSKARLKPPPSPLQLSVEGLKGDVALAPLSPAPGSANIVSRMNTIAPGPFDARHKKSDSRDTGSKGFSLFRRKSNKRNKPSISGPTAIVDVPVLPTSEPGLFVGGELDRSGPLEHTFNASKLDNFGQPLPTGPAPPRPARPGAVDPIIERLQISEVEPSKGDEERKSPTEGNWRNDKEVSKIDAAANDHDDLMGESAATTAPRAPRVTSDASVYTVMSSSDRSTTFGKELPQIREDEDPNAEAELDPDAPPAWPSGRLRSASRITDGSRNKQEYAPPVPNLFGSEDHMSQQHHTPTDSVSSQESRSVFDDRRDSFRSSPPTSAASSFSPEKRSMDDLNELNGQSGEMLTSATFNRAANFSRPRATTESESQSPQKLFEEPESSDSTKGGPSPRRQEAFQDQFQPPPPILAPPPRKASLGPNYPPPRSSSRRYAGPGTFTDAPPSPMIPMSPMFPPTPLGPSAERRPNTPRKSSGTARSCCRGCDLPIEGKSVKAADGRLSGRYHRECFVCKACKERFQTAEFYILDDHPYCGPHYHELNGSLCLECNRGIEGRYIETEGERKHHLYCFTCNDCSKPLSQDYFEIDGKFYCEADAGRMHQKTSMLTPGRKFPERRTTRLMMM